MTKEEFNLSERRKKLFEAKRNGIYSGIISDYELEEEIKNQDKEFIKLYCEKLRRMEVISVENAIYELRELVGEELTNKDGKK